MLFTIAISLLYVEIKESVFKRIFSEIVTKFWSEWELRCMVIVSLILQFLLVYFGWKRKNYTGEWVQTIAISSWLIFLLADWMATVVLSTLLRGDIELENGLVVLWTPFLLWHLGSPNNVTAQSLEDNELWLRHFVAIVFQIGEAVYIYVRYRSNTVLNALAVPLFFAGVFKFGERIWALRCASSKLLINFSFSNSTSQPHTGGNVVGNSTEMIRTGLFDLSERRLFLSEPNTSSEVKFLREAYTSFDIFMPLFADLPFQISHQFHDEMVCLGTSRPADEAFNFVGIELEYLYDLLFTKNPIQHRQHPLNLILRSLCFVSLVTVLIAFSVQLQKMEHSTTDIVVTFLLLSGTLCLEMYSFFMHFNSKWTMLRYGIPKDKLRKLYYRLIGHRLLSTFNARKRIRKMAQHDLIYYFVKARASWYTPVIKLIDTADLLQRFGHLKWKSVDNDLKEFIYSHLKQKRSKLETEGFKLEYLAKLLGEMGDNVIKENVLNLGEGYWKMESTDFIRRIFVWHIATALVYHDDVDKHRSTDSDNTRIGKSLSDYMMYLVLVRPSMLPNGFSEMVNKGTYDQAQRFSPPRNAKNMSKVSMKDFVSGLISLGPEIPLIEEGALLDGVKFAKALQGLVREERWDNEDKWKMMSEVWMEMMVFAASRCPWKEHAQQLRHGGELLTHVSLLMAHLGLSTQVHRLVISRDHLHNHDGDELGSMHAISFSSRLE